MSENYPEPRPSVPEQSSSEAEIAAWINQRAEIIDERARASGIVEVDTDNNPDFLGRDTLVDGLHRTTNFAGHGMFIIENGSKIYGLYFLDAIAPHSFRREQTQPSDAETRLHAYRDNLTPEDSHETSNWFTSSRKVVATAEKILAADRVYSLRYEKNTAPHSMKLTTEQTITVAAETLDAIETAIDQA
jgi:hypothetical protein